MSSTSSSKSSSIKKEDKPTKDSDEDDEDDVHKYDFLGLRSKIESHLDISSKIPGKSTSESSAKIPSLSTVHFELKKKEMLEKKRLEEAKKKKYEERLKELTEISESCGTMEREREELRAKLEKKKFEASASKEKSKSEILKLKKELIEAELKQHNISNIMQLLKDSENVEICFLIDVTGSMDSVINDVKNTIHKIVDRVKKRFRDFNLRCAFVGYRDIEDGVNRITALPFTEDIDSFKSFVSGVEATGGADQCEDVFGGLEEAVGLDWTKMTRVLFHVADAPCHGERFHCGALDSHPTGDPRGLDITNLLRKVTELNLNYFFAQMNDHTVKMIDEFNRELAELNGNKIEVVKYGAIEGFENTVATTISTSISRSKSTSFHDGGKKTLKKFVTAKITWSESSFKSFEGTHYIAVKPKTIDDVKNKIDFTSSKIKVMIANQPFDRGSIRYAFAAWLIDPSSGVKRKYVAKESLFDDPNYNTYEFYQDIVENQVIASYLANKFFKISKSEKSVRFLDVTLMHVKETGKYYSLEEFIESGFIKWTNNAGYVNEETYASTLNAFSHWTYQITNEYLVVADLQGFVKNGNEYVLTDPAIECPDGLLRFTSTNLGIDGVKKFFESHQCNPICKFLRLKKHKCQKLPDKISAATKIKS